MIHTDTTPTESTDTVRIHDLVNRIRAVLPPQNPWSSFIHLNPLVGYEALPFFEGVERASRDYAARALPGALTTRTEHRTLRLAGTWTPLLGEDVAELQREWLSHWLLAYFDQGVAEVSFAEKASGFLTYVRNLLKASSLRAHPALDELSRRLESTGPDVDTALAREFRDNGLPSSAWEAYARELAFDLKGWSGIVSRFEMDPRLVDLPTRASFAEWILVRVALENAFDAVGCARFRCDRIRLKARLLANYVDAEDSPVPHSPFLDRQLRAEAVAHDPFLKAIADRRPSTLAAPSAFVLTCMDDREESIRRHLETTDPSLKTFGVLGHFGIDLAFQSKDDARTFQRCPPPVTPKYVARETARSTRGSLSRWLERLRVEAHFASRRPLGGALASLVASPLLAFDLLRSFALPSRAAEEIECRKPRTPFGSTNPDADIVTEGDLKAIEADPARAAELVRNFLVFSSIDRRLPSLVVLVAHTSSSRNNPFRLAYGCGACCGRSGDANARLLARLANRADVQALLTREGFEFASPTVFVPALHDTCTDQLTSYESDVTIGPALQTQWHQLLATIETSLEKNAAERARRFESFRPSFGRSARNHVRLRARDPGQVRPEYGHSRLAFAVFGRRDLTRDLDLDRRSFLISYDPSIDADGRTLRDVLEASLPVCANIHLDYHFSALDNDRFGAGSKAPLNIGALSSVMMGTKGDLRTGLPRQMVEVHEPIRLCVLVEASGPTMQAFLAKASPRLQNLVRNDWILLHRIDPVSRDIETLNGGRA